MTENTGTFYEIAFVNYESETSPQNRDEGIRLPHLLKSFVTENKGTCSVFFYSAKKYGSCTGSQINTYGISI